MEFKDYYQTLGVERGADAAAIKAAYRRLARKYHPDVSKEADAETRFKEINEAYEVLKDADKRQTYDRFGSEWKNVNGAGAGAGAGGFRPPPGWDGGFQFRHGGAGGGGGGGEPGASGFSDFFESLFGGAARQPRPQPRAPEDQQVKVDIGLEDSFAGATRNITLQMPQRDADGRLRSVSRRLNVKIPKGVIAGQKIRLGGQGGGGGDLLLEVGFRPHPLFRVDGRDVTLELPVTPWEAALGTAVTVPTLAGRVEVKVRPGSQSGQKLRLKGRGLPHAETPGDQYIVLKIVTPPADDEAARELYQRMAETLPFNPRRHLGG